MLKRFLTNLFCIVMVLIWITIPILSFLDFKNPMPDIFLDAPMFISLFIQSFMIKKIIDENNRAMFLVGAASFIFAAILVFRHPNPQTAYRAVCVVAGIFSILFYGIFLDENIKKYKKEKPRDYKASFKKK